jgi:hypothetical protein
MFGRVWIGAGIMAGRDGWRILAVSAFGLMLGGCVSSGAGNQVVTRAETRITSSSPLFARADTLTVTYADPWTREDYTLFQSPDVHAEFLYASAVPGSGTGLVGTPDFARALQSWNINQGARQMGQIWRRDREGRSITYQPYRLDGPGWGCVALQSDWGVLGAAPTDTVFGYVCNKNAAVLSRSQALRIVDSLTFLDAPRSTPASRRLPVPAGADPVAVARGASGDGLTGLDDFPFGFGQPTRDSRVGYGVGVGVGNSVGVYGGFGTGYGYGYYPYDGFGYYPYGRYGYYPYGGYGGFRDHDRNRGHDRFRGDRDRGGHDRGDDHRGDRDRGDDHRGDRVRDDGHRGDRVGRDDHRDGRGRVDRGNGSRDAATGGDRLRGGSHLGGRVRDDGHRGGRGGADRGNGTREGDRRNVAAGDGGNGGRSGGGSGVGLGRDGSRPSPGTSSGRWDNPAGDGPAVGGAGGDGTSSDR